MIDPNKSDLNKGTHFFRNRWVEIISGLLMLVGIILSFFYLQLGGALVGLGFGVCFFEEIHTYLRQLRELYVEQGIFKSLMLVATILYFLISIPAFIIAVAIGFGAVYLIRFVTKK